MHPIESEEGRLWRLFLTAHSVTVAGVAQDLRTLTDISLVDLEALVELGANGGRMRMAELAESMGVSRSGITRCVDRLGRRGLVKRAAVPDDKRGSYAVITPSGRTHLEEVLPAYEVAVNRRFASILTPAERTMLSDVLERLRAAGDADSASRTGA